MTDLLIFGEEHSGPAIDRPAAYGLVRTDEGVAVVVADRLFLPGGGMEDGESPEEAVVRELREECRLEVTCVGRYAEAMQLFSAQSAGRHYRSHMYFIECRIRRVLEGRGDHETRWLKAIPRPEAFAHRAHHWAFAGYFTRESGR